MGFRFKKSIGLGGGVRLNAGNKGVGISAGVKGLRVSHGVDGKTRVTANIPGTGISYQETISGKIPSNGSMNNLSTNHSNYSNYSNETGEVDSRLPFYKAFNILFCGLYEDGVFDHENSFINSYSNLELYDDTLEISVGGSVVLLMYTSVEGLSVTKSWSKGGILAKVKIDRGRFGDEEVHFRFEVDDEDIVDDLITAIENRKEYLEEQYMDDVSTSEITESYEEGELFGHTHSVMKIDEEQSAIVVSILSGSISSGDEVFIGNDESIVSLPVESIFIEGGGIVNYADSELGTFAIILNIPYDDLIFVEDGGIIRGSIEGFLM